MFAIIKSWIFGKFRLKNAIEFVMNKNPSSLFLGEGYGYEARLIWKKDDERCTMNNGLSIVYRLMSIVTKWNGHLVEPSLRLYRCFQTRLFILSNAEEERDDSFF